MTTENVGVNIQTAREKNGLSRSALAEVIGVRANTVWRWESGERQPDIDNLYKLAYALKTSVAFFTGEVSDPDLLSSDLDKIINTYVKKQDESELKLPGSSATSKWDTPATQQTDHTKPSQIIETIARVNREIEAETKAFEEEEIDIAQILLKRCLKTLEKESSAYAGDSEKTA